MLEQEKLFCILDGKKIEYGTIVCDSESKKKNIKLNNGKLSCSEWFDIYDIEPNTGRIIIGYLKPSEELNDYENHYRYGAVYRGKYNVKAIFDRLTFSSEETYIAHQYDKNVSGYIDSITGLNITPMLFINVKPFKDGIASVEYKGERFYISRNDLEYKTDKGTKYSFKPENLHPQEFMQEEIFLTNEEVQKLLKMGTGIKM